MAGRQQWQTRGVVAAMLVWTAVAAGQMPNPAAQPGPRLSLQPDPNWLKRHEGFVEIARQGGVDLLFLGDSITDAWRYYDPANGRGGKRIFDQEFAPLKAANFGIGGDQTQHVLWRIQNGELDGIQPKVVMLMIGTNNLAAHSAEQIAAGITAIVQEIHKRSPKTKVLLLGIFPRGKDPGPVREKIKEINRIIARLDDGGKTVQYLDIGEKFLEPDGSLSPEIMYDYLHLTEKGYRIWADAVKEPIQKLLRE
jgi:lysophospholipase L1-like esterase